MVDYDMIDVPIWNIKIKYMLDKYLSSDVEYSADGKNYEVFTNLKKARQFAAGVGEGFGVFGGSGGWSKVG